MTRIQDALQKWSADLPDGKPIEQVRAILDRVDAEGFVQSLSPAVLFRLIEDAGWDEAAALIPLATAWQFQCFLDFDAWRKDRFEPGALTRWLDTLLEEASDQKFRHVCRELDPETLALLFKAHLITDLVEDGEVPESLLHFEDIQITPCGQYAIVFSTDDEETIYLMRRLIDRLYQTDMVLAWTLLEAVRWEYYSMMEEEALRWRRSRLEEFGFVPREEAYEIYAIIDPTLLRQAFERDEYEPKRPFTAPQHLNLPVRLQEKDSFFFRTCQLLDEDGFQTVFQEFISLQNKTLIADGLEPSDLSAGGAIAERTLGYLDLGLEFISRKDAPAAARALTSLPIREIFRAGWSLTLKLKSNALAMERRPTLTLVDEQRFSLLRDEDQALLTALAGPRPQWARDGTDFQHFSTMEQVDDAALRLGLIAFKQVWLFGVLGVHPERLAPLVYSERILNDPSEVSFDLLFSTVLANVLLGKDPELLPLVDSDLTPFLNAYHKGEFRTDPLGFFEPLIGLILEKVPAGAFALASRWLQATIAAWDDEFERVRVADEGFLQIAQESFLMMEG